MTPACLGNRPENLPAQEERDLIAAKLADGLTTPRPERRPLPQISLEELEIGRQDI